MIGTFLHELSYALRRLRMNRVFTATAVGTLSLGIGATTSVFSVVYGVAFRPLPFPTAARLVQIVQMFPPSPGRPERTREGLTPDQIVEWRATSRSLEEIGYYSPRSMTLGAVAPPVRLNGATVSVSLFRALGVHPIRGRLFLEQDEQSGEEKAVILSHSTWVRVLSNGRECRWSFGPTG